MLEPRYRSPNIHHKRMSVVASVDLLHPIVGNRRSSLSNEVMGIYIGINSFIYGDVVGCGKTSPISSDHAATHGLCAE